MNQALRWISSIGALIGSIILITLYLIEYHHNILPCPLCYIQQTALLGIAISEFLNVRFGISVKHFALAMCSALIGFISAFYQLYLQNFVFTDPTKGSFANLRLSSWSLIIFSCVIIITVLLLFLVKEEDRDFKPLKLNGWNGVLLTLLGLLALGSTVFSLYFP